MNKVLLITVFALCAAVPANAASDYWGHPDAWPDTPGSKPAPTSLPNPDQSGNVNPGHYGSDTLPELMPGTVHSLKPIAARVESADAPSTPKMAASAAPAIEPAKYAASDIATLKKLWKGYAILQSRRIYNGGDANADLLLSMRHGTFIKVRGVANVSLGKGMFPFTKVLVTLTSEDGKTTTTLKNADFLFRANAEKYAAKQPADGTLVDAYLTVYYNFRRISSAPFFVDLLNPVK
ncbi:MAG TPA: hypothetical protein PLL10_05255 [Elusimicrobiales bacterium]|nr:hypothetical protein [Elusimicrobiales bacterium]